MGELKKELHGLKDYIALAVVAAKNYQKTNIKIIKYLTKIEKTPGVYVTLNKPFTTLQSLFKKNTINPDMVIFIDAVTEIGGEKIKKTKNCLFIGSPEKLSDISMAMDQAIRAIPTKERFVFFDSLSTLLMYNNINTVARFIHFLAGKMRIWKVKGIIISLQRKEDKELISKLTQFCDVTLDFGGG